MNEDFDPPALLEGGKGRGLGEEEKKKILRKEEGLKYFLCNKMKNQNLVFLLCLFSSTSCCLAGLVY